MSAPWTRRARPLLGTLVEIGIRTDAELADAAAVGFAAIARAQACLSRFEAGSDIARFNAMEHTGSLVLQLTATEVLGTAAELQRWTDGLFDISLGSAPDGWRVDGDRLIKLDARAQLDLGGIGKGHAVDCAVQALIDAGVHAGWVNAGGDLRAFGDAEVPVQLRDEQRGGVRLFATLHDGSFATSCFGGEARAVLACETGVTRAHVSVAAPRCLWADALTKVVAATGDTAHPLLARFGASAWRH